MTIDLSKAKKGDTVHFRCGGKAVIQQDLKLSGIVAAVATEYGEHSWYTDGKYIACGPHPSDITRIEPAPFDWKDVKPGMAFRDYTETVWFYIGKHPFNKELVAAYSRTRDETCAKVGANLTRAPEHDIQVLQ